MTIEELIEIEAIKQLKHRYVRCLDLKLYDELADCFTDDASSNYDSGKLAFEPGKAGILAGIQGMSGRESLVSCHRVTQPEIELLSPTTAKGTWAMEATSHDLESRLSWHSAAYYHDEYVKVDGRWKISVTGYERVFEQGQYIGPYSVGIRSGAMGGKPWRPG